MAPFLRSDLIIVLCRVPPAFRARFGCECGKVESNPVAFENSRLCGMARLERKQWFRCRLTTLVADI